MGLTMALPNFDELQRLKLEQMQKSMVGAMYPSGFMGQRSPLEHVIEQVAAANSAYMHPAAASMYNSLSTITQSIHALRAIFFTAR